MTTKTVTALTPGFLGSGAPPTSTHHGQTIERGPVGLGVALGGAILFLFPFPRRGGRLAFGPLGRRTERRGGWPRASPSFWGGSLGPWPFSLGLLLSLVASAAADC